MRDVAPWGARTPSKEASDGSKGVELFGGKVRELRELPVDDCVVYVRKRKVAESSEMLV
jgi:hypothetical protein